MDKGCPFKYFQNKDGSYNNNCRKEYHGLVFEDIISSPNITVETFDTGCLNYGCCDIVSRYLVNPLSMSSILSIEMSCLLVIATFMSNMLWKKHYSGLRKIRNGKKYEKILFTINAVIFIIWVVSYYLRNYMLDNIVYKSTVYLDDTEISNISTGTAQHVYTDRCFSVS